MTQSTIAICLEYPLSLRGGVSVIVEELARGMAPHFRLVLVSPDEPDVLERHPYGGFFSAHIPWKGEKKRLWAEASRSLAERLRAEGCALAHLHIGGVYGWGIRIPGQSPFGFLARAGMAVCSTVHLTVSPLDGYCGSERPLWFKLALWPMAWIGKLAALRHTRVEIAVSRYDEARLRRWYLPFATRFRQMYHSRLRVENSTPEVNRNTTILNVGHVAHRKGQHILAEAFSRIAARHPQWELHLAGSLDHSPDVTRVRDIIERTGLGSRIHLLGSRDDALALMRGAGIYVQPSLHEALGLALQEALFAGCPSIGSTAGGIPELIANGDSGILVPKGDVDALTAALDRLISDSELRQRLGGRARPSMIERGMTADAMIQNHLMLYRELLAAR